MAIIRKVGLKTLRSLKSSVITPEKYLNYVVGSLRMTIGRRTWYHLLPLAQEMLRPSQALSYRLSPV